MSAQEVVSDARVDNPIGHLLKPDAAMDETLSLEELLGNVPGGIASSGEITGNVV